MQIPSLRAWYAHKQGLGQANNLTTAREVFARAGWARSVGGANPYLMAFSRARVSREQVDEELANLEIAELPSARGCTYVLPKEDFAAGLTIGAPLNGITEVRTAKTLGVSEEEISTLKGRILEAVQGQVLEPAQIRQVVGDAARNLGPEGKKKGLTTTLPLAISLLQSEAKVIRKPVNGRIDAQRYGYIAWNDNPLQSNNLSFEEAGHHLAYEFFKWTGPALATDFSKLTTWSMKACKPILDRLKLVEAIPGTGSLILPEDLEAFQSFNPPDAPHYRFVSGMDNLFHLRHAFTELIEAKDIELSGLKTTQGMVTELEKNVIVDRGQIVGLWEYDSFRQELVWATFEKPEKAILEEAEIMQTYCRDQLGDVRYFSLDSPESRKPRVQAVRTLRERVG